MYRQCLDNRNTHVLTAMGVIIVIIMKKIDWEQQIKLLGHAWPNSLCAYVDIT